MDERKQAELAPPPVGGASLLVVFAVLCLTVFALLSLSTVRANGRLSETSAQAVADYYAADCAAQLCRMASAAFWHSTAAASRASFRAEAASERTKAWTHSAAARANTSSITICSIVRLRVLGGRGGAVRDRGGLAGGVFPWMSASRPSCRRRRWGARSQTFRLSSFSHCPTGAARQHRIS